ncbi:MAG: PilZ domain-containing protein [Pseudomonadales bacterium]
MSSAGKSYSEKRDFIRMRINSQVDIRHAGNEYYGICKDLSGAGMLIETDQVFEIGVELEISIAQKEEAHLPFNATAKVSRVLPGTGNKHIIGLAIKEICE